MNKRPNTAREIGLIRDQARYTCGRIEQMVGTGNWVGLIDLLPDLREAEANSNRLADEADELDLAEPQIPTLFRQAAEAHRRASLAIVTAALDAGGYEELIMAAIGRWEVGR